MKIIAFYLPQFHEIPENNLWWGKGFTEWTNVKKAEPLTAGHNQPRRPLDGNYYDLTDPDALRWQSALAKKYGIYGFCYYHYWFDGKLLLQKPAEIMLQDRTIDLPFCFCWANETWTNSWVDRSDKVLIEQTYGGRDMWKAHFDYLLPFFRDDRYIKIEGKPLVILYRPQLVNDWAEMAAYWKELAAEQGIPGLVLAYQQYGYDHKRDPGGEAFDFGIEYQPSYAIHELTDSTSLHQDIVTRAERRINRAVPALFKNSGLTIYDYDELWKRILDRTPANKEMVPGAFADWDNTARRKDRGSFCRGVTPEKFEQYLTLQLKRAKDVYEKDMLFLFAWNEWGECGYLEPDTHNNYRMLEAVRNALRQTEETK
ncbi:glycosyltransferase WbsX family protein [Anaerobium acetethylicum]|uniref:Glycosyltransferase WbsX n=1 Tax=Anaerobium acetethylicum TaxID=1619234 RepID=A0A1D3TRC9_9FIRM|nr:glycoside hydrolase family 99-like domain-containing protein [Anaerobium acetethylicum]SCP96255.1 hypothetical protein SAMN05421730_100445 [Anaerobium acetethylicum]